MTHSQAQSVHRLYAFLLCSLIACSQSAGARSILVLAPHSDDEALMASGVIYRAKSNGDSVHVVVMTNGDSQGKSVGLARQSETVSAMSVLGLNEQEIIFLGYGGGTLNTLYKLRDGGTVVTSKAGEKRTYGTRGLGHSDFHRFLHGKAGEYTRNTIVADLKSLLKKYNPDDIYTTSFYDDHPDHRATYGLLIEALLDLIRSGSPLRPRIHETFIHAPGSCPGGANCGSGGWPRPVFTPGEPFPQPNLHSTPYRWNEVQNIPVPAAMQDTDPAHNLKYQTIAVYVSQAPPPGHSNWLQAFVKKNEFFWIHDFGANLAPLAQVAASSEQSASGQSAPAAVDGVIAGDPLDADREWVPKDYSAGAWLSLSWTAPVTISRVRLYDRPSPIDNILSGILLFSDGSSVAVPALPQNGAGLMLDFDPKTVTWLKLRIERAQGKNPGLAEIEVFGVSRPNPSILPQIVDGPEPDKENLISGDRATLTIQAFDVEGKPLRYTWSCDLGSISGDGPVAVFRAPSVATDSIATITVAVQGEHGTVHNSAFVQVRKPRSRLKRLASALVSPLKWLWHFLRRRILKAL